MHCVLQVKENMESTQQSVIVCTNQVLSAHEAPVMQANSWLYHYYMVQSKLQYGGLQVAAAAAAAAATVAYETTSSSQDSVVAPANDRASTVTTPVHYHQYHTAQHEPTTFESAGDRNYHHHHHHPHHQNDNNLHQYGQQQQQHMQYNHNSNQPQYHHRRHHNNHSTDNIRYAGDIAEPVDYSQQHGRTYGPNGDVDSEPVDEEDSRVDSPPPDEVIVDLDRTSTTVAVQSRIYQTASGITEAVQLTTIKMNRPLIKSITACDPATEFMEQWNPSPPWSDTLQKVPDIVHHDLSSYVTTTPPTPSGGQASVTPTSTPVSTSATNVGAFTFDWIPEQYVPNVTPPPVASSSPAAIQREDHRQGPVENSPPASLNDKDDWQRTGRRQQVGRIFQLGPPPPPRCHSNHINSSSALQNRHTVNAGTVSDRPGNDEVDVDQAAHCRTTSTPTSRSNSSPVNACVNMC